MEENLTGEEKRFCVAMDLLVNAVDNVIWNCEYTGMTATLIDYLRDTADDFEKICIEEYGEDWREDDDED